MTTITCANGEVISLRLDTTLPRPYSREFTVRGTKGLCIQNMDAVLFESNMDMHEFFEPEKWVEKHFRNSEQYKEYLPAIWTEISEEERELGHGGMDYFQFKAFFKAIINQEEIPIDVYDMAAWMAITPLSEQSIAHGGMPQAIPDFTRGQWMYRQPKDVVEFPKVETKPEVTQTEFGYSRKTEPNN